MRSLFLKVTSIAVLSAGLSLAPLNAQEREAAGPVPTRADANNPDSEVYRASDVMNLPVKNDEGAEVGRIKDLVINGETREVLYAVVAMNDAKQKDALYVMPWTVFQPNYGARNALRYTVLSLPQTVWMQAPFYSPAQWQQATFSQWGPRVNNYYAQHITAGNTANTRSTPVRVNKPNLNGDDPKASTSPKTKPNAPIKNGDKSVDQSETEKPAAKPKAKPNSDAAKPETAGVNEEETSKIKPSKSPAPKNPDPADPKVPAPAPRDPKTPAPTPK